MNNSSIQPLSTEPEKFQVQESGSQLIHMSICPVLFLIILVLGYEALENHFFGRLIKPILTKYYNWERSFQRNILLQRGLVYFSLSIDI